MSDRCCNTQQCEYRIPVYVRMYTKKGKMQSCTNTWQVTVLVPLRITTTAVEVGLALICLLERLEQNNVACLAACIFLTGIPTCSAKKNVMLHVPSPRSIRDRELL